MSKHHCWYVTGRTLRLALAFVLFVSLFAVNPAFATEGTALVAQKTAISDSPVTAPVSAVAEQLSIAKNVAGSSAAYLDSLSPAAGNLVDGVIVLPKTGEVFPAVLDLTRNRKSLGQSLIVWERDLEYFVPVTGIAQILKFPTTFDPATLKVEGEFFNPQNRYSIDAENGTYTVLDETHPLPEGSILKGQDNNDLYVTVDFLNQIWSLDLEVDIYDQSLSIGTNRKLPVELEIEREKRQKKLERQKQEKEEQKKFETNYIYTPNGYRLLGPQTFFLSQRLRWDNSQKDLKSSTFASGEGDFLGTSASYSLNISNEKSVINIEDFAIRLRRQDYKSGKILPFGLDLIDLGDIAVRSPSLVAGSLQGTGLYVSTDRDRQNVDFDEVIIEGNAQPGWDVEVYSRGVLIDFGVVDELGRYRFENVPLTFGNNNIRLVFYGPQGEIEERTETYSIARSFLKPGEMTYQAGVVKRGDRVINLSDNRENNGETDSTFRINRGINSYMSGYATFTNLNLNGTLEKYISLGANFNALGGYGQVEAYKQLDKGTALDVRYARNFLGFDTNFRSSLYKDFESQKTGRDANRKETETSLSVIKRFASSFAPLNLGFSLDHTTYAEADSETRLSTAQSIGTPRLGNLSHTTTTSFSAGHMIDADGQLAFGRSLSDNFGLNSKLSYDYFPQKQFNSADFSLSYTDNDRLTASLGYGQSLVNTDSRTVSLGAAYNFDTFTGNANLSWDSADGIDFLIGANTTFGPQGEDNLYEFRRKFDGQPTRLSIRLFEDINGDGIYGPEDTPLPGARVVLNGGRKSGLSDEEGYIDIAPAGGEGSTTITLDRKSMTSNPFLIPARKDGYITILRAGTKPHIDFPLTMSGTVDGTIRDQNGRGMAGITVQLIDAQGKLAGENVTVFDGFYSFELVRPGRYVVQVHPSHRVFVPPKTVRVASDDLFVYGADLQVLSNQSLEQAKEAAVADDVGESGRVAHTYHHSAATVGTEKPVATTGTGGGVQPAIGTTSSEDGVQPVSGNTLSDTGVQPVIRAVRFGEYPDKTRLVLDLSGPADYRIIKEDNGSVITVDLLDTKWEADSDFSNQRHSLFQNIEIKSLPSGSVQIKLIAQGKVDVLKGALLPAQDGRNDRIYIDFKQAQ